ncbi:MAG TPA: PilT/PilU family type 4a pilus ATPase [Rhodocyclaceae bacterium]|nr:PilT/PilU family type 4a pilus ATPase [Rhodocyclaceae bacterium]
MQRLFQLMSDKKASDMFMAVGSPINIKINGMLVPINQQVMDVATIRALLEEVVKPEDFEVLVETQELNTAVGAPGIGRFRISVFYQRGTISAVLRFIQNEVPAIETLALPATLPSVIMERRGLMLVVGSTGSGKSTTIASLLDYRNRVSSGHILTLEDPVEFVFKNKKSIVNQREIGTDAKSFEIALKNALRQAPDVIFIGEIRDKDTMSQAIAYAQSGHLCVATLHANNSYQALSRIIGFYPLEARPPLLADLSVTLRCIVSQRLVKKPDGTRTPAAEVLLNSKHIAELMEKGDIDGIREAMQKSLSPGSQTFEQALYEMYSNGTISLEEALGAADSANNLQWLINNTQHKGGNSHGNGAAKKAEVTIDPAQAALAEAPAQSLSFDSFELKTD